MPSVLLYDMLYHPIRARQTHFRFVGSTGDSFFGCNQQIMVKGCGDLATNATNGQLISECRQDCGYRSRCLMNDVDNVAAGADHGQCACRQCSRRLDCDGTFA